MAYVVMRKPSAAAALLALLLFQTAALADNDWPEKAIIQAETRDPWPPPPASLDLTYECGRTSTCSLHQFMERVRACALYVVKDGMPKLHMKAAVPRGCDGNDPRQRFGVASVAKSITALLFGRVAFDADFGAPLSPDMSLAKALSPLELDFRGPALLRDLLQMRSGIPWVEGRDKDSLRVEADNNGNQVTPHRSLYKVAEERLGAARPRRPDDFNYSGLDSLLIGLLAEHRLKAAANPALTRLSDALGKWFWTPLAMAHPAEWKGDFENHPAPFCCFYTAPEDLARLGQWVLERYGEEGSGDTAEMAGWIRQSVSDTVATKELSCSEARYRDSASSLRYGYQWWLLSGSGNGFTARGSGGQFLHILPDFKVVIVQFSEFDQPLGGSAECESYLVHRRIAEALSR